MCEDSVLGPRVKARKPIREVLAKVHVECTVVQTRALVMEEQEVTGLDRCPGMSRQRLLVS